MGLTCGIPWIATFIFASSVSGRLRFVPLYQLSSNTSNKISSESESVSLFHDFENVKLTDASRQAAIQLVTWEKPSGAVSEHFPTFAPIRQATVSQREPKCRVEKWTTISTPLRKWEAVTLEENLATSNDTLGF